jgi:hypothetical protein
VAASIMANSIALSGLRQARTADTFSTPAAQTVVGKPVEKTGDCDAGEVTSIDVSREAYHQAGTISVRPEIDVEMGAGADEPIRIKALGPVLGSMDSPEIVTKLRCTERGLALTATITRSADFHGAALQNQNWRPMIAIALMPRQPNITFETIWRMRLTTGAELTHAQTPPHRDQKYPMRIMQTIRGHRKR